MEKHSKLSFAGNCSEKIFNHFYDVLLARSATENEALYQTALSKCSTAKERNKAAGCYSGPWQMLFNAWCQSKVPNLILIQLLKHKSISFEECDHVIDAFA